MKQRAWIIVLVVTLLSTACQPTPKQEQVIGDSTGETVAKEEVVPYAQIRESFLQNWSETFAYDEGGAVISFETGFSMPEVEKIPIVGTQNIAEDAALMQALLGCICQDYELRTTPQESGGELMTKQDYLALIEECNDRIENVDEYHPEFSEAERSAYLQEQGEELTALTELYQTAPNAQGYITVHDISAELETLPLRADIVRKNDMVSCGELYVSTSGGYFISGTRSDNREVAAEPITTADEARLCAEALLSELGLEGEYRFVNSTQGDTSVTVYFGKVHYGVPTARSSITSTDSGYTAATSQGLIGFCFPWEERRLREIIVNEQYQVTSIEQEESALLDFAQLRESIELHCSNSLSWKADGVLNTEIRVKGMELAYRRVVKAGETGTYLLIPVWTLTGDIRNEAVWDDGESVYEKTETNATVMVIDARTGALIHWHDGR
ncbi:MAG: DUF6034 family protein [Clostridia bacterium]|nr:DUF6034 family protein [Clostridia bacterium]